MISRTAVATAAALLLLGRRLRLESSISRSPDPKRKHITLFALDSLTLVAATATAAVLLSISVVDTPYECSGTSQALYPSMSLRSYWKNSLRPFSVSVVSLFGRLRMCIGIASDLQLPTLSARSAALLGYPRRYPYDTRRKSFSFFLKTIPWSCSSDKRATNNLKSFFLPLCLLRGLRPVYSELAITFSSQTSCTHGLYVHARATRSVRAGRLAGWLADGGTRFTALFLQTIRSS